jgi:hypothetical protein
VVVAVRRSTAIRAVVERAEYELRRLQALLKRAEVKTQDASLTVALAQQWGQVQAQRTLDFWTGEVGRLRAELRQILAAEPADEPCPSFMSRQEMAR